jgi:alpha-glucosidase (family GH31 glycosyl hydrolase)
MSKLMKSATHASALSLLLASCALASHAQTLTASAGTVTFHAGEQFRFSVESNGKSFFAAHRDTGLLLDDSPIVRLDNAHCSQSQCTADVISAANRRARIAVRVTSDQVVVSVHPEQTGLSVVFKTAGAAPAFGLADHAVLHQPFDTDVTGFSDDHFLSGEGLTRLVSNFVIYPRQNFAMLLIDPGEKIIQSNAGEIAQGTKHALGEVALHIFLGDPHTIYAAYRRARIDAGYPVMNPKPAMFGVGWEAFGALGWNTNQKTVLESVDRYRALGFPLRWLVIGSGYWPAPIQDHETTSFGMFNPTLYPDPKSLLAHFRAEGLPTLFGLRIDFTEDGPFTQEGLSHGYFLTEDGKPRLFRDGWPQTPYYLLDAHNSKALAWYIALTHRWGEFGVAGYKEDYFGFKGFGLPDDKVDPVDTAQMKEGQYIIERNGYLSSNGDLHRINDFNYDQNQDRGPVNSLALAYAGFPLVYPDIVGGTFGEDHFNKNRTPRMERYMMRNAQWASLHPSMGMGEPPWNFENKQVGEVMLKSAQLHDRLQPYIYSQAVRFAQDGYPWTMTPLAVAFPADPAVYGRENDRIRGYEWMIGDALLATPLYGEDYATADNRDVYLPAGNWMEYDSGKVWKGPLLLHNYALPIGMTPLFVGGSGIVVERREGKLYARIYPVAEGAVTKLRLPDASSDTTIRVTHALSAQSAASASEGGKAVQGAWVDHAFQFEIKPGNTYVVK